MSANNAIKKSYKFTSREDWLDYAMTHMKRIQARQQENSVGTEILLISKRGVIGKWCDELSIGFIEEYRDGVRLARDRMTNESA